MMKRAWSVFLLLGIVTLFGGCATMDTPGRDGDSNIKCLPGPTLPSQIAVMVYQDASGEVQVLPELIVVSHPNQTIIWTAIDGEISDIEFEANDCSPGPPSLPGQAKQKSTRIPRGHIGEHKYSLVFHPAAGGNIPIDPVAVVEY